MPFWREVVVDKHSQFGPIWQKFLPVYHQPSKSSSCLISILGNLASTKVHKVIFTSEMHGTFFLVSSQAGNSSAIRSERFFHFLQHRYILFTQDREYILPVTNQVLVSVWRSTYKSNPWWLLETPVKLWNMYATSLLITMVFCNIYITNLAEAMPSNFENLTPCERAIWR